MPQSSRRCLYDAVERPKRYRRISRDPTDAEAIFADGQYLISDGIGDIGPSKRLPDAPPERAAHSNGDAQGLPVSLRGFVQNQLVRREIGDDPLETRILLLIFG